MRKLIVVLGFCLAAFSCNADDDPSSIVPIPVPGANPVPGAPAAAAVPMPPARVVPIPALAPRAPRPLAVPVVMTTAVPSGGAQPNDAAEPVKFSSEGKWGLAGYNNNEVIYTILVTNHDFRIIRCSLEMQGFYFENGKKLTVSDRQSTTVFPEQEVQAGNWAGMDQPSGATYTVKCHPL